MGQDATVVVGIDVAKNSLEVSTSKESFSVANDEKGLEQLIARLAPLKPELVVLEASGGYEKAGWLALWGGGNQGGTHQSARCVSFCPSQPAVGQDCGFFVGTRVRSLVNFRDGDHLVPLTGPSGANASIRLCFGTKAILNGSSIATKFTTTVIAATPTGRDHPGAAQWRSCASYRKP